MKKIEIKEMEVFSGGVSPLTCTVAGFITGASLFSPALALWSYSEGVYSTFKSCVTRN